MGFGPMVNNNSPQTCQKTILSVHGCLQEKWPGPMELEPSCQNHAT